MFEVEKNKSTNKTIRMPDDLIDKLDKLAAKNEVSFSNIVVQCCKYAYKNLGHNNFKDDLINNDDK